LRQIKEKINQDDDAKLLGITGPLDADHRQKQPNR